MENYTWDPDSKVATYTIKYKDLSFTGQAFCAPEDSEIAKPSIGIRLAELRATRYYLRHVRDNEVKPAIAALKQLYYSMKHSNSFDPKSYEAKMLFRQIRIHEEDLESIKDMLRKNKYIESFTINHI